MLTLNADAARERYQKVYARFASEPAGLELPGTRILRQRGREIEIMAEGNSAELMDCLRARAIESLTTEALTLEEIFVTTLQPHGVEV